jgi:hypothetical protein
MGANLVTHSKGEKNPQIGGVREEVIGKKKMFGLKNKRLKIEHRKLREDEIYN